jgi:hypothetical protein
MPKRLTEAQRLAEWLVREGWQVSKQTRVTRYTVWVHKAHEWKYFVGKGGAFRRGPNVADAVNMPKTRALILAQVPAVPL